MWQSVQPDQVTPSVPAIDGAALAARGLRGVLLDLDNTLTRWSSCEIAPEIAAWVAQLRAQGLRACIVSNATTARRVRPVAAALGVPFVTRALKPLPGGLRRAMRLIGTTPETTCVIGDQLFTDVLGGARLGLYTILVDPLDPRRESWITRAIQRPLERLAGR